MSSLCKHFVCFLVVFAGNLCRPMQLDVLYTVLGKFMEILYCCIIINDSLCQTTGYELLDILPIGFSSGLLSGDEPSVSNLTRKQLFVH